ncbi:hypothetical protein B0H14DRAFT_2715162 [Mycena olivaceomarginata]|nr:hypothetical protein B0H14DRAFT_2715162 [Mycena olivaceomarginata]
MRLLLTMSWLFVVLTRTMKTMSPFMLVTSPSFPMPMTPTPTLLSFRAPSLHCRSILSSRGCMWRTRKRKLDVDIEAAVENSMLSFFIRTSREGHHQIYNIWTGFSLSLIPYELARII